MALGKCGLAIKLLVGLANRNPEAREFMLDWSTPGSRVIQFQLYGEEPFYVAVEAGRAYFHRGSAGAPDTILRAYSKTFWDIMTGAVDPDAAFSMQRYDIIGSIDDAIRLRYMGELIQGYGKSPLNLLNVLRKLLALVGSLAAHRGVTRRDQVNSHSLDVANRKRLGLTLTRAFRPDEYVKPRTIREAVSLLRRYGIRAKIVAGGTALNELAKRGMLPHVVKLVDIEGLGLDYIEEEEDSIRIGAMTTVSELASSPILNASKAYHGLVEAALAVRPVQVRNVATAGGAICGSLPFFDLPVALLALDAKVKISGPVGERFTSLDGFFKGYFLTALRSGELLTEILLPKFDGRTASTFEKLQLTAEDLPLVNVAVRLTIDGERTCKGISIAYGGRGTARTPIRITRSAGQIEGKEVSEQRIEEVSSMAVRELKPITDHRASAEYRRRAAKALLKRALRRSLELLSVVA